MIGNTCIALIVAGLFCTMAPQSAQAFDTPLHLEITTEALRQAGIDAAAIGIVNQSNELTDTDAELFNTPAAHFDNERFTDGATRLRDKMTEALNALSRCDRQKALEAIGTSLHSVQDFYSHSNAVEIYPDPRVTLDLFSITNPAASVECRRGAFGTRLTSGYWPDLPRVPGKCSHADMAKDGPKRGQWYRIARARAVTASVRYIEALKVRIGSRFGNHQGAFRFLSTGADSSGFCQPAAAEAAVEAADRIGNAVVGAF